MRLSENYDFVFTNLFRNEADLPPSIHTFNDLGAAPDPNLFHLLSSLNQVRKRKKRSSENRFYGKLVRSFVRS